jgi:hypothetical protein
LSASGRWGGRIHSQGLYTGGRVGAKGTPFDHSAQRSGDFLVPRIAKWMLSALILFALLFVLSNIDIEKPIKRVEEPVNIDASKT